MGTLLLPFAAAQDADKFEPYVQPQTEQARDIKEIFDLTFWIAMVIFVGVEGLLFYFLWRWRKNKTVPADDGPRGHTTAEVVWTIIPALILLFLGIVSAGTLFKLDNVPDDTDYTISVTASQWAWRIEYPDGNFSSYAWAGCTKDDAGNVLDCPRTSAMRAAEPYNETRHCRSLDDKGVCNPGAPVGEWIVRENARVRVELTATDVIHALAIPEFGIKVDANPGSTNVRWFTAPAFKPGGDNVYFVQCMEYCQTGHHAMHARITVVPAGDARLTPGGWPAAMAPAAP